MSEFFKVVKLADGSYFRPEGRRGTSSLRSTVLFWDGASDEKIFSDCIQMKSQRGGTVDLMDARVVRIVAMEEGSAS